MLRHSLLIRMRVTSQPILAAVLTYPMQTGFGGTGTGAPMNQGTSYGERLPVAPLIPWCSTVFAAASVVQDGAFANWQLQWPTPHLLTRNFTTPRNGGPDAGFMGSNY